jgi:hypothetical protein
VVVCSLDIRVFDEKSYMQIRVILCLTFLFLPVLQVSARDVQVGTTTLQVDAPQGYCELDPAQPADAVLIQSAPTKNMLLSHSVECTELADYRSGKRALIDHWARQVVLASLVNAPSEADPKAYLDTLCEKVRQTSTSVAAKTEVEIRARIEKNIPLTKYLGSNFQGLLAQDNNACYTVTVTKFTAQNGVDRSIVFLTAFVMIRGKLIYHFLYAPFVDVETPIKMLAEHRKLIAAIETANR